MFLSCSFGLTEASIHSRSRIQPDTVERWQTQPSSERAESAPRFATSVARRRDIILHDAKDLAFAQGLELVEDEALLAEVAGLVEWPVVLMGSFDEAFLDIPAEVEQQVADMAPLPQQHY